VFFRVHFLDRFCDVYVEHSKSSLEESGVSLTQIRKRITQENPYFELIWAVSIAAKHVKIEDDRLEKFIGLMSTDTSPGKAAPFSDGTYFSDGTSWSDSKNVIRVKVLNKVYDMLVCTNSVCQTIEAKFP
jgi:hypothetical protein